MAEIRDLPSAPEEILPADRLQELEWMIGDWVDQNGNQKIHSSVKWGENKAYLTRTTTVNAGEENSYSSLMVLGYDAQSGQLRSWLFDSDGGRGEATWTRASDVEWILRAVGRTQTIQGQAGYQDDVLILGQQDGPPLAGKITFDETKKEFSFKPPGAPADAAGLNFTPEATQPQRNYQGPAIFA